MIITRCRIPLGFSLLEVVLAMSLSALVFVGLGFFATWQGQLAENRHRTIAESQVARVVLDQIARDLRNAVIRPNASTSSPTSASTTSTSATSSTSSTASASSTTASSTVASSTGTASTSTSSPSSTTTGAATTNLSQAGTLSAVPGVYGTANQLQVDVYHIPSFSERIAANQSMALGNPLSGLSDVRTTLYFVDVPRLSEGAEVGSDTTSDAVTAHLLKVSLPRATVMWQSSIGGLAQLWSQGRTYAPEVRMLECWYFDGTQWLTSWNTELYGRLPVAVQVYIWVDSLDNSPTLPPAQLRDAATSNSVARVDSSHIYSTVVTFPVTSSTSTSSVTSSTTTTSSTNSTSATTSTTSSGTGITGTTTGAGR